MPNKNRAKSGVCIVSDQLLCMIRGFGRFKYQFGTESALPGHYELFWGNTYVVAQGHNMAKIRIDLNTLSLALESETLPLGHCAPLLCLVVEHHNLNDLIFHCIPLQR